MQGQGGRWSSQQPPPPSNPDPFAELFASRQAVSSAAPVMQTDPFAALANQMSKVDDSLNNQCQTGFDWDDFAAVNKTQKASSSRSALESASIIDANSFADATDKTAAVSNAVPDPFGFGPSSALKPDSNAIKLGAPRSRLASPAAARNRKESTDIDPLQNPIYPVLQADQLSDLMRSSPQPDRQRQSISSIIQNASAGDFASIRCCRSLHRKRALLAAAVDSWDTDIIIEVALFLEETLKQHLLLQLLSAQPIALNAFLAYLERQRNSAKLAEIYKALNRHEEAGLHMLNMACVKKDAHSRLASVGECQAFFESNLGASDLFTMHTASLQALLTRQIAIEERDLELAQSSGDPIWVRFPRNNIIGHPVNHLIRYCIIYHPNAQKNKLSNAKGVRDAFEVTDKEWTWINLDAKAELGDWAAVSKLVQKTTFTRKAKCPVGFNAFVEAYGKYHGPRTEMVGYAEKIADLQQRYDLCMKFGIFDVAAETLSKLNDEERLKKLRMHIQDKLGEEDLKALCAAIDTAIVKCSRKAK